MQACFKAQLAQLRSSPGSKTGARLHAQHWLILCIQADACVRSEMLRSYREPQASACAASICWQSKLKCLRQVRAEACSTCPVCVSS